MKALIYSANLEMQYSDATMPTAAAGETVLKILYCGVCGSDRHAYHGKDPRRQPPLILGHEAVGEAEDGQHYIINPLISCGHCRYCIGGRENLCLQRELIGMKRPGAFAEYIAMPNSNLLPLPATLSPHEASLAEPAACAWRVANLAAAQLPYQLSEARALVLGAGAIGILSALSLSICGCRHITITDTQATRCAVAEQIGVTGMLVEEVAAADESYDVIVDAVGAPSTRALACSLAAAGGVIVHIGLEEGGSGLDTRRLTLEEITFVGSYTYTPAQFSAVVALLADGAFGDISGWSSIRPLAEGGAVFQELDDGLAPAKVILQP